MVINGIITDTGYGLGYVCVMASRQVGEWIQNGLSTGIGRWLLAGNLLKHNKGCQFAKDLSETIKTYIVTFPSIIIHAHFEVSHLKRCRSCVFTLFTQRVSPYGNTFFQVTSAISYKNEKQLCPYPDSFQHSVVRWKVH